MRVCLKALNPALKASRESTRVGSLGECDLFAYNLLPNQIPLKFLLVD